MGAASRVTDCSRWGVAEDESNVERLVCCGEGETEKARLSIFSGSEHKSCLFLEKKKKRRPVGSGNSHAYILGWDIWI